MKEQKIITEINQVSIYYLHKGDGIPFYIGKTICPKTRFSQHKFKHGFDIILEIIDEVPINEWKFWEMWYIELYKSWGFKLINKSKGGGGGVNGVQNQKDLGLIENIVKKQNVK